MSLLEVNDINVYYGAIHAIKGISFSVDEGEVVTLIKETSVAGYIAIQDLTKISDLVRARTYQAFFALIFTAIIYFLLSGLLTRLVGLAEKRVDPKSRSMEKILEGIHVEA